MTRINLIKVSLLTNKQLLAEYRELPRIINKTAKGKMYKNIPARFTMGTGHESFFANKLSWLHERHQAILAELSIRQINFPERFKGPYVIDTTESYRICIEAYPWLCKNWVPSEVDVRISMDRLIERLGGYIKPDYWGDIKLDKDTYINLWVIPVFEHIGLKYETS